MKETSVRYLRTQNSFICMVKSSNGLKNSAKKRRTKIQTKCLMMGLTYLSITIIISIFMKKNFTKKIIITYTNVIKPNTSTSTMVVTTKPTTTTKRLSNFTSTNMKTLENQMK
jgi:hypothetical protein